MSWNMIGHAWAVDLLRTHFAQERLRHAYLLTGPDGVGKRTLALQFARALNCEAPPEPGGMCGQCRACRLIPLNEYPDLHIVQTTGIERQLKVDQVRTLQRALALSPYEGRRRIALLLRFHEATEEAANALLKTLEEPPAEVVMLLTARSAEALLPTIVSRCEVLALRTLPQEALQEALQQRGEPEQQARLLAAISAGRPGWAISMAQDPERLSTRAAWLDDLNMLLRSARVGRFDYVENWHASLQREHEDLDAQRQACLQVLQGWLGYVRDALLLSTGAQANLANPDRAGQLDQFAAALSPADLEHGLRAIVQSQAALTRNANIRLVLEALMLDLPFATR